MAVPEMPMTPRTLLGASLLAVLAACGGGPAAPDAAASAAVVALESVPVGTTTQADRSGFDGVVQAVRQTAIAAQVPGAVVALNVKAGDTVKAGQVLLRLDARAAQQAAAAGGAQVLAARAMQDAATKEYERQKQLYASHFISRAALDQAEAQYKATQAQAQAQLASAGAAQTESTFYVVKAPYDGVVADVAVVLGDMAMPGRPLLTVYDPAALRISAAVPQTVAAGLRKDATIEVELPGAVAGRLAPSAVQLLPTVDPATHTLELRADLPAGLTGVTPGMFARAWLPGGAGEGRLFVPQRAVVRRAELTAVYVVAADGRALLRQVRLGRSDGERVEVLSGLGAGERVALEPQAAARGF
jgi:RND family efflux transporter MFP subunit